MYFLFFYLDLNPQGQVEQAGRQHKNSGKQTDNLKGREKPSAKLAVGKAKSQHNRIEYRKKIQKTQQVVASIIPEMRVKVGRLK